MGLFDIFRKKERKPEEAPRTSSPPPVTYDYHTRKTPSGVIIDYDNSKELPKDGDLLMRSARVYWNGALGPNLVVDMEVCRNYAALIYDTIFYYGLQDTYPEAGYYVTKHCMRNGNVIYGQTIDVRRCAAHMCQYYIMHGQEVNFIQEPILFYLEYFRDGMDQVLAWLRQRVEQDKAAQADPIGLIMLRHYLVLRRFPVERDFANMAAYWLEIAQKYHLREAVIQSISYQLVQNGLDGREHTTMREQRRLKMESFYGNPVAAQMVYGTGIDKILYDYDGLKRDDDGNLFNLRNSRYKSSYVTWEEQLPVLKQEQASLGSGWFDRETAKADQEVETAFRRHEERQQICGQYVRALYLYARGHDQEALDLMCRVETSDATHNAKVMTSHKFRTNLSPAASWWISRHSTGLYDRSRQYRMNSDGVLARVTRQNISVDPWYEWDLWNEAEELAEQLHDQPNPGGFLQLARLADCTTPYWWPLEDMARKIRQDVLTEMGEEGLITCLLEEPDTRRVAYARALIYDPEVNRGDESRIEAGWLTLINHRLRGSHAYIAEAVAYVNRFFDYPEVFAENGLNIRYVTNLALQGDENALRILGELYMDFEEIHGGSEYRRNVGQLFYSVISRNYYNKLRTLDHTEEEKTLLRKWYSFEHYVREDASDYWIDRIGIFAMLNDMPDFCHLLARKTVFDYFVKREGRLWVKLRLGAAVERGHREAEALYRQLEREDEALEFARMEQEERRRRLLEEEEKRSEELRKSQLQDQLDNLERMLDRLGGGMGFTNQEQLDLGKGYLDYLRDKDVRKALEDLLR